MEYAIIVVLILLLLIFIYRNSSSENFVLVNDLAGTYTLAPKFSSSIRCNPAKTLQVVPQRSVNPNYLDLIVHYENGRSNMVRTNLNVGNIFSYYDDINNVQYLTDPTQIQYELHTDTGEFKALTVVTTNNGNSLKLMDYQITSRVL